MTLCVLTFVYHRLDEFLELVEFAGGNHTLDFVLEGGHALCADDFCRRQFHRFDRLAGCLFDNLEHFLFTRGDKEDGVSAAACAACTADAVHIRFGVEGNVVVHHVRNAVHVDSAGGHVGGDNDIELAHLESVDGAFTHGLGEVAVQRGHVESAAFQLFGDFGGVLLGAHENQHAVKVFAFEHAGERFNLVLVLYEQVTLADVFDGCRLAFDAGFFVFAQVLFDNLLDFFRHGGAKEGALGVCRDFLEDGFDIFHESHVEHFVGFVENDSLHARKYDGTALDMVDEATRSSDHDICLALEGSQLHGDVLTAVNRNHMHLRHLGGVLLNRFGYLDGEFAGRREHEHRGFVAIEVEPRKERKRECRGLSCTSLGGAEQVSALQKGGNCLCLNGGGRLVVQCLDGFKNFVCKSEVFEGYQSFVARFRIFGQFFVRIGFFCWFFFVFCNAVILDPEFSSGEGIHCSF